MLFLFSNKDGAQRGLQTRRHALVNDFALNVLAIFASLARAVPTSTLPDLVAYSAHC